MKRPPGVKGFVVIRRRWVVERIFAWILKCRRVVRDYEQLTTGAETLITKSYAHGGPKENFIDIYLPQNPTLLLIAQ